MNRSKLKSYAPQARRDFIRAVMDRAGQFGLERDKTEPIVENGDVAIIAGKPFPRPVAAKRKRLEAEIARRGFDQFMEAMAYTWFNRLMAIRFMELHGYLDHGYRVLSPAPNREAGAGDGHQVPSPAGRGQGEGGIPEILLHAEHVDLPGLDKQKVVELKLDGTKDAELYRMLLVAQCNALHAAMPFLFERIDDETELLLPDNLLHSDSLVRKMVREIDEEDWQEVEIIGWLYQFYISERKDEVIGKVVTSEDIPAATQLFTPNWIVKYLVQNSLGRQWLATYPNSPLRQKMDYYIEPAEQTPEVQAQLKAITPTSLNPEELTLLDPACGSGHILVEAYDLLKAIYQERGYRAKDIPRLILEKNLFGLEICDRAAQLAAFSLMMKARADDRRFLGGGVQPHVLAIQDSNGLDAEEIAAALDESDTTPLPPRGEFEFMDEIRTPLFAKASRRQAGHLWFSDVAALLGLFKDAKTFGSLIQVPATLAARLPALGEQAERVFQSGTLVARSAVAPMLPLVRQAALLARGYGAVVANPPYMGAKYFTERLKDFIADNYQKGKADLYACFLLRNIVFARGNGFVGMITIPNWMFLSSFEGLRDILFERQTIDTFVHNGRGVFGSDFGSCAFVVRTCNLPEYKGIFRRLFDKQGSVATNEELAARFATSSPILASPNDFKPIPTRPVAYWVSDRIRNVFLRSARLEDVATPRQGVATADNGRFLRRWFEVSIDRVGFGCTSNREAVCSGRRWFPHKKGGDFRKWFGNNEYVINWQNDGEEIRNYTDDRGRVLSRPQNTEYFFREGVTWSHTSIATLSVRYSEEGSTFNCEGPTLFSDRPLLFLGYLGSSLCSHLMHIMNPTVHFLVGSIALLPFDPSAIEHVGGKVEAVVREAVKLAREDWNYAETSWEFEGHPLIRGTSGGRNLEEAWKAWEAACRSNHVKMKALEQENNSLFITAYGLECELNPGVPDEQITLHRPGREEDIIGLMSYAVGCVMGRYSLDKPGLIYAHSGNVGFDPSQCKTFSADSDGIVPLTETDWFPDDAANRVVEFIGIAWPKEHLAENLEFVADSLGPNQGDRPRDTIRRYLATGFFKHHLQMYKRRPIYWLFSSGKQRAFQCLVYLHRYHEGTLSRMRTEYVIPLSGKISARIDQLAGDIAKATSTSHRKKLEKEKDKLVKQQAELALFDEKLRHYADQRISLDLDDGVKVNYAKFGDLLAEVRAVTGTMEED